MNSDPRLLRWYKQYRARFFTNTLPLPSEMELLFDDVPPHGQCEEDEAGETNIIRIYRGWGNFEDVARMTLLHEMAHIHIAHWRHGEPFQKEMLRLATLGAFRGLW